MLLARMIAAAGLLLAAIIAVPASGSTGHLLLVGGDVSRENTEVYRALIDNRPEGVPGIVIIAAASANPADSATLAAEALEHHGAQIDNVVAVRLAVVDDPMTAAIDESSWASNASDAEEISKIESAGAIWFTGGDQARLAQALLLEDGSDSLMMAAIRVRLSQGAIVGGAAALGDPVIARGDAFNSMFGPVATSMAEGDDLSQHSLTLSPGLGLFRFALVDQHFAERGRIGRLVRAALVQPENRRIGLGIDDDTALLVDLGRSRGQVIGLGSVTIADARQAISQVDGQQNDIRNVLLSRLHAGDGLDLLTFTVRPSADRSEAQDRQTVFGGLWPSVALASPLETEARTFHVAETRNADSAEYSVTVTEGKRRLEFDLHANTQTRYWRSETDIGWRGTLVDALLAIRTTETNETR